MKREYVEKAAWNCVNAPCIMDCSQCEDKYKEDCIWSHLKDGFVLGAEWRINSVWHTMDEVQDGKRPYIVQYNEECKFAMFTKPIPVPLEQAKSVFKRWAYIEDLIPMED